MNGLFLRNDKVYKPDRLKWWIKLLSLLAVGLVITFLVMVVF